MPTDNQTVKYSGEEKKFFAGKKEKRPFDENPIQEWDTGSQGLLGS
ncbi:hypothetical protein KKG29_02990 [Patescibacteria group bacterium]|nr:hypothetical protein [Patescibacteria group bacterium]MBU4000115.1 hypothetical protein [Patescibacteria group bacterium]MBU4056874.1 hypothetical protein [Patescibacteria group bacterium]MBU4368986.1 hypothetical protein [Patescibacteria group bacterium]